jgi:hypothetical protein
MDVAVGVAVGVHVAVGMGVGAATLNDWGPTEDAL